MPKRLWPWMAGIAGLGVSLALARSPAAPLVLAWGVIAAVSLPLLVVDPLEKWLRRRLVHVAGGARDGIIMVALAVAYRAATIALLVGLMIVLVAASLRHGS